MGRVRLLGVVIALAVIAGACGSSGSSKASNSSGSQTSGSTQPVVTDKSLGTGVTATSIKVGVMMIDYNCVAQFVDSLRPDQQQAYQIFIDDINAKGGINGRKIVPVYKTYCPIDNTTELTACTALTEDSHVFAVIGTFYDPSGDAQLCFTKQHKTPVVADSLTDALAEKTPGLMVTPDIAPERRLSVIMALLKSQGTLKGKKVATVSDSENRPRAKSVVDPALKDLGVERGTDAVLSITGSDTTAAQAQLDSFIERWKSDGTNALMLVGQDVASKQFVEKIKAAIPNMLLVADNTSILDAGREDAEGPQVAEPLRRRDHGRGPDWRGAHEDAALRVLSRHLAEGHRPQGPVTQRRHQAGERQAERHLRRGRGRLPVHEFLATIANRVGPYLNDTNWVQTVNNFGSIDDTSTIYASIHKGKYDADNTYGLVAFNPAIGDDGDWDHLTPVENVSS